MKTGLLFFLACFLLAACGNKKSNAPGVEEDSAQIVYSWQVILNDSTGRLEMKKVETIGPDTLSPEAVVSYLNSMNNNVQLAILKISGDTVYLKIQEASYLTQQMGSTGSTMYLAQVIYNLTEIAGINYVMLDFEEGDHASPGTFTRDSFKDK